MLSEKLYVFAPIFNPAGYKSRYDLYYKYAAHVTQNPNVRLITIELAYDGEAFSVTSAFNPNHIQIRSSDRLWHKENLINVALAKFPEAQKIAWIDCDIEFQNPYWADLVLKYLDDHDIIQPFSLAVDRGPEGQHIVQHISYMVYATGEKVEMIPNITHGDMHHPGYAWAARRDFLDKIGGLFDLGILGSGDWHMACAFGDKTIYGMAPNKSGPYGKSQLSLGMITAYVNWADKVATAHPRIGYVNGTIYHNWHGAKKDRGYQNRWKILLNAEYDPACDLKRTSDGLLQLTDSGEGMREDIIKYFTSRNEDSLSIIPIKIPDTETSGLI